MVYFSSSWFDLPSPCIRTFIRTKMNVWVLYQAAHTESDFNDFFIAIHAASTHGILEFDNKVPRPLRSWMAIWFVKGLSHSQQWGGWGKKTLCHRLNTSWIYPSRCFPLLTWWVISSDIFLHLWTQWPLLTPALCKASRWVLWGISPPSQQLQLRYAQWAPTGIWAAANQWLSFAVDRIHYNRGTFSEWSLSTCISVTETLVQGINQRGHILWLLMPWALSPSQRNKKQQQPLSSEQKSTCTSN